MPGDFRAAMLEASRILTVHTVFMSATTIPHSMKSVNLKYSFSCCKLHTCIPAQPHPGFDPYRFCCIAPSGHTCVKLKCLETTSICVLTVCPTILPGVYLYGTGAISCASFQIAGLESDTSPDLMHGQLTFGVLFGGLTAPCLNPKQTFQLTCAVVILRAPECNRRILINLVDRHFPAGAEMNFSHLYWEAPSRAFTSTLASLMSAERIIGSFPFRGCLCRTKVPLKVWG